MRNNLSSIFLTECDLEFHDLLYPFKQEMIESYFVNITNEKRDGFSVPYTNKVIDDFIAPSINQICNNIFNLTQVQIFQPYIYVQSNRYNGSIFHKHWKGLSNSCDPCITVNCYIDPPAHGGQIEFLTNIVDNKFDSEKISVEKNKLYFFPSWLYHRPLPQQDDEYRICVSIDIFSKQRPFFKPAEVYW